uniref:Uncharacterized protein n=1 Tax=Micrurus lemniscatus lemniscatus TaxID=129467 RepID=A0A2D4HU92_MICLE
MENLCHQCRKWHTEPSIQAHQLVACCSSGFQHAHACWPAALCARGSTGNQKSSSPERMCTGQLVFVHTCVPARECWKPEEQLPRVHACAGQLVFVHACILETGRPGGWHACTCLLPFWHSLLKRLATTALDICSCTQGEFSCIEKGRCLCMLKYHSGQSDFDICVPSPPKWYLFIYSRLPAFKLLDGQALRQEMEAHLVTCH